MGISQFLTVAANTASGNPEPSVGVVVATGLILVFGVLVLLYLLITLEGIIFTSVDRRKKGAPAPKKEAAPAPVKAAAPKAPVVEAGIPGEVVAAIAWTAANIIRCAVLSAQECPGAPPGGRPVLWLTPSRFDRRG